MRHWDFEKEWTLIFESATAAGVDPYAVAAIRVAENGSPGRDFGVLAVDAPDYAAQLRVTCTTLRHRISEHGSSLFEYKRRLCLTRGFVVWFRKIWAPDDVANDPQHLNENWVDNFWNTYLGFVDEGGPIPWQQKRLTEKA